MRIRHCLVFYFLYLPVTAQAQQLGESVCGALNNAVGPFDYRTVNHNPEARRLLKDVERNHFNKNVQALTRGQTSVNPIGDLDYVLRAFPNHSKALMLVIRYSRGGGGHGGYRTTECYLDRALRFTQNDPTVHVLQAIHLTYQNELVSAVEAYQTAIRLNPDYIEAHYNLGLLFVRMEEIDEAVVHAVKAYELGALLPGLRNQLQRRHAWPELQ